MQYTNKIGTTHAVPWIIEYKNDEKKISSQVFLQLNKLFACMCILKVKWKKMKQEKNRTAKLTKRIAQKYTKYKIWKIKYMLN